MAVHSAPFGGFYCMRFDPRKEDARPSWQSFGWTLLPSPIVIVFCLTRVSDQRSKKCKFTQSIMGMSIGVLAGLAFMFSASILLQILACALYSNWWPMLSALMYVLVPMPCLFFAGGSTDFFVSRDDGGWVDMAKFLTGASAVGSIAIPAILRHANLIGSGAMFIEFTSFFILVCTILCFHRASIEDSYDNWS